MSIFSSLHYKIVSFIELTTPVDIAKGLNVEKLKDQYDLDTKDVAEFSLSEHGSRVAEILEKASEYVDINSKNKWSFSTSVLFKLLLVISAPVALSLFGTTAIPVLFGLYGYAKFTEAKKHFNKDFGNYSHMMYECFQKIDKNLFWKAKVEDKGIKDILGFNLGNITTMANISKGMDVSANSAFGKFLQANSAKYSYFPKTGELIIKGKMTQPECDALKACLTVSSDKVEIEEIIRLSQINYMDKVKTGVSGILEAFGLNVSDLGVFYNEPLGWDKPNNNVVQGILNVMNAKIAAEANPEEKEKLSRFRTDFSLFMKSYTDAYVAEKALADEYSGITYDAKEGVLKVGYMADDTVVIHITNYIKDRLAVIDGEVSNMQSLIKQAEQNGDLDDVKVYNKLLEDLKVTRGQVVTMLAMIHKRTYFPMLGKDIRVYADKWLMEVPKDFVLPKFKEEIAGAFIHVDATGNKTLQINHHLTKAQYEVILEHLKANNYSFEFIMKFKSVYKITQSRASQVRHSGVVTNELKEAIQGLNKFENIDGVDYTQSPEVVQKQVYQRILDDLKKNGYLAEEFLSNKFDSAVELKLSADLQPYEAEIRELLKIFKNNYIELDENQRIVVVDERTTTFDLPYLVPLNHLYSTTHQLETTPYRLLLIMNSDSRHVSEATSMGIGVSARNKEARLNVLIHGLGNVCRNMMDRSNKPEAYSRNWKEMLLQLSDDDGRNDNKSSLLSEVINEYFITDSYTTATMTTILNSIGLYNEQTGIRYLEPINGRHINESNLEEVLLDRLHVLQKDHPDMYILTDQEVKDFVKLYKFRLQLRVDSDAIADIVKHLQLDRTLDVPTQETLASLLANKYALSLEEAKKIVAEIVLNVNEIEAQTENLLSINAYSDDDSKARLNNCSSEGMTDAGFFELYSGSNVLLATNKGTKPSTVEQIDTVFDGSYLQLQIDKLKLKIESAGTPTTQPEIDNLNKLIKQRDDLAAKLKTLKGLDDGVKKGPGYQGGLTTLFHKDIGQKFRILFSMQETFYKGQGGSHEIEAGTSQDDLIISESFRVAEKAQQIYSKNLSLVKLYQKVETLRTTNPDLYNSLTTIQRFQKAWEEAYSEMITELEVHLQTIKSSIISPEHINELREFILDSVGGCVRDGYRMQISTARGFIYIMNRNRADIARMGGESGFDLFGTSNDPLMDRFTQRINDKVEELRLEKERLENSPLTVGKIKGNDLDKFLVGNLHKLSEMGGRDDGSRRGYFSYDLAKDSLTEFMNKYLELDGASFRGDNTDNLTIEMGGVGVNEGLIQQEEGNNAGLENVAKFGGDRIFMDSRLALRNALSAIGLTEEQAKLLSKEEKKQIINKIIEWADFYAKESDLRQDLMLNLEARTGITHETSIRLVRSLFGQFQNGGNSGNIRFEASRDVLLSGIKKIRFSSADPSAYNKATKTQTINIKEFFNDMLKDQHREMPTATADIISNLTEAYMNRPTSLKTEAALNGIADPSAYRVHRNSPHESKKHKVDNHNKLFLGENPFELIHGFSIALLRWKRQTPDRSFSDMWLEWSRDFQMSDAISNKMNTSAYKGNDYPMWSELDVVAKMMDAMVKSGDLDVNSPNYDVNDMRKNNINLVQDLFERVYEERIKTLEAQVQTTKTELEAEKGKPHSATKLLNIEDLENKLEELTFGLDHAFKIRYSRKTMSDITGSSAHINGDKDNYAYNFNMYFLGMEFAPDEYGNFVRNHIVMAQGDQDLMKNRWNDLQTAAQKDMMDASRTLFSYLGRYGQKHATGCGNLHNRRDGALMRLVQSDLDVQTVQTIRVAPSLAERTFREGYGFGVATAAAVGFSSLLSSLALPGVVALVLPAIATYYSYKYLRPALMEQANKLWMMKQENNGFVPVVMKKMIDVLHPLDKVKAEQLFNRYLDRRRQLFAIDRMIRSMQYMFGQSAVEDYYTNFITKTVGSAYGGMYITHTLQRLFEAEAEADPIVNTEVQFPRWNKAKVELIATAGFIHEIIMERLGMKKVNPNMFKKEYELALDASAENKYPFSTYQIYNFGIALCLTLSGVSVFALSSGLGAVVLGVAAFTALFGLVGMAEFNAIFQKLHAHNREIGIQQDIYTRNFTKALATGDVVGASKASMSFVSTGMRRFFGINGILIPALLEMMTNKSKAFFISSEPVRNAVRRKFTEMYIGWLKYKNYWTGGNRDSVRTVSADIFIKEVKGMTPALAGKLMDLLKGINYTRPETGEKIYPLLVGQILTEDAFRFFLNMDLSDKGNVDLAKNIISAAIAESTSLTIDEQKYLTGKVKAIVGVMNEIQNTSLFTDITVSKDDVSNVYDKSYWNHFFTDVNAEQLTFKQIGIDEVSRHFFRSEDVLTLDIKNAFGNRADQMLKTLKSLGIIKSVDSSTYEVVEEKQDSIGRITKGLPASKQVFVEKYGKALLGVTVDLTPEQRAIVEELYSVLEKIKARDLSSVWAGYLGKMPNGFGNLLKPKTTSQLHGERKMLLYEAVKKGIFAWAPMAVPLPIILKQFLVVNPASAITLAPLGAAVLFNNLERSIDNKILQMRANGLSENDPLIKQQKLFKTGARAMQVLSIVATIYASVQTGAWVLALALPLFYFTYAYLQQTLISIKQHVEKGFMGIPEIQDEFAAALKANPLALEDGFIEDGAKEDKQGKGRFLIREGLTK